MNWKQLFQKKKGHTPYIWGDMGASHKMGHSYDTLCREGFESNVIVYRCINLIAKNVALPPWCLYKGSQELEDHFLLTIMANPSPQHTQTTFLEGLVHYLLIDGNAYVEACQSPQGIERLLLRRPDCVRVLLDKAGDVCGYEVTNHSRKKRILGVDDLLHVKMFHPHSPYYGLSPIQVAAGAIDQHNAVGQHNISLLKNGGRPSGALLMPGTSQNFSAKQRQELKQSLQYFYQGEQNAGKMLVLEGGMDWKDMGLSPRDLDFVSGKHLSMREIAQVFGVPSMLVGVPGDSTFANYREARFHLWEDTVLPLLNQIVAHMNRWLVPRYGDDLCFAYNADEIPALLCRRERLWQQIEGASFLTVNEKRAALGYSKITDGDTLK